MQQFFSLTLPGLSPIMFYTLVVNIIQAFQSFGQIKILTEGGPNESTNVIVYSIYRDAFFNYRFGSAAAQSVILFVIIMIITLIMFRIEKKGVNTDEPDGNMAVPAVGNMSKEELLELKKAMNAKALAKRRTRTALRVTANVVFAV